jgi:diguanylate cyclase (GGDEF)-like protein
LGVLTLYSTQQNAFDENHRRIIEAVARQAADRVAHVLKSNRAEPTDPLGGLPNRQQLQRFLRSELGEGRGSSNLSLIFVSIGPITKTPSGDQEPSARVIDGIRRVLRDGDILFRYGDREFVVLLARTDGLTATRLVATMTTNVSTNIDGSHEVDEGLVAVAFGTATAPSDGTTAEDLVKAARSRVVHDAASSPDSGSIH